MKTLERYFNRFLQSKRVKWGGFFISIIISLFVGYYIRSIIELPQTTVLEKVGLIFGFLASIVGLIYILIEKALSMALADKELELKDMEIKERKPKEIGQVIASHILPLISKEIDSDNTVFNDRFGDYFYEKKTIAKSLVRLLEERVTVLKNREKKVEIIVDAGTTLSPFLDVLGSEASNSVDYWTKDIRFYTNNVHGIQKLLKYKSEYKNVKGPSVNIPIVCDVLPGRLEASYFSTVSSETLDYLENMKNSEAYRICITTGRYVLSSDNPKSLFPVARPFFHPEVKAAMMELANEIYIVAPLGKIPTTLNQQKIEELLLNFNEILENKKGGKYEETPFVFVEPSVLNENASKLIPDDSFLPKTILVTTSRENNLNILYNHSLHLQGLFERFRPQKQELVGPYIFSNPFSVDKIRDGDELSIEFPNKKLRNNWKLFFYT